MDPVVAEQVEALAQAGIVEPLFKPFPKIARLSRPVVITEKIDGTNAAIWISDDATKVIAGSRNRWISPGKNTDNFGFAAWVEHYKPVLIEVLGPGLHHGEWWGQGIARNYGLQERRLSMFNPKFAEGAERARTAYGCPLYTVPILWEIPVFETEFIYQALRSLSVFGSVAAPGFKDPEGIVVFCTANNVLFKKTIKGDEKPKGSTE
jgi:hypothetical protein